MLDHDYRLAVLIQMMRPFTSDEVERVQFTLAGVDADAFQSRAFSAR